MALSGIIGNLAPFDPAVYRFSVYVSRVQQYFIANEIPNEKKLAVFIAYE